MPINPHLHMNLERLRDCELNIPSFIIGKENKQKKTRQFVNSQNIQNKTKEKTRQIVLTQKKISEFEIFEIF